MCLSDQHPDAPRPMCYLPAGLNALLLPWHAVRDRAPRLQSTDRHDESTAAKKSPQLPMVSETDVKPSQQNAGTTPLRCALVVMPHPARGCVRAPAAPDDYDAAPAPGGKHTAQ